MSCPIRDFGNNPQIPQTLLLKTTKTYKTFIEKKRKGLLKKQNKELFHNLLKKGNKYEIHSF